MVKLPKLVSTTAVYFLAGSMHIGGAFANDVVRSAEPSVGGHGVSPVMDFPAIVVTVEAVDAAVVLAPATVVSVLPAPVVAAPDATVVPDDTLELLSLPPTSRLMPNATAMNATSRIAPRMTVRLRFAADCSASWASRRA